MKHLNNLAKLDSAGLERLATLIEQRIDRAVENGETLYSLDSTDSAVMHNLRGQTGSAVPLLGNGSSAVPSSVSSIATYTRWAAIMLLFGSLATILALASKNGKLFSSNTALVTLHVPKGSIGHIVLSDGTKIVLNSNSSLSYPEEFKGTTREVSLTGEAYFEVTHNTAKPFYIHSGKLLTRVTGTSFDIRSFARAKMAEVTVRTGHVIVTESTTSKKISLSPQEKASLNMETGDFVRSAADAGHSIAWQDGKLVFDAVPLSDVLQRISEHYNVGIAYGHLSVDSRLVTAEFDREPLTDVLKILSAISHVNCRLKNNSITISESQADKTKEDI